jgi:hypothetical protein
MEQGTTPELIDDIDIDEDELPVLFGLFQSIPPDKPEKPPTDYYIVKKLSWLFRQISSPIIYIMYLSNEIPLEYTRINHAGIMLLILILPIVLFLVDKYYISKKKSKKIKNVFATNNIYRTVLYITCIWMSMFAVIIFFYPRLQNIAK